MQSLIKIQNKANNDANKREYFIKNNIKLHERKM